MVLEMMECSCGRKNAEVIIMERTNRFGATDHTLQVYCRYCGIASPTIKGTIDNDLDLTRVIEKWNYMTHILNEGFQYVNDHEPMLVPRGLVPPGITGEEKWHFA